MDSSTDEDEEFFETLEDIASSSDADSGAEELQHSNVPHSFSDMAPHSSYLPYSKYEVWKNSPGSITERRERLLSQMGLKVERQDPENKVILVDRTPAGTSSTSSSSVPEREITDRKHTNPESRKSGVFKRKGSLEGQVIPGANAGWTMVRSRSDGTFSRLQDNDSGAISFPRLVRSGTTSPDLHDRAEARVRDSAGSASRTGITQANLASKPPLGGRKGNVNSLVAAAEGQAARKVQYHWSKFGRFRVTDKNGNSLFDSTSFNGRTQVGAPERLLEDGTLVVGQDEDAVDREILCRIKDLDSGKEFIVNEVGKDGMWNKLKELDTGREITLEEFESSLGLSPIVQEVMRRERAARDIHAANIQGDGGLGAQKKKKGWLTALKGVVKGSRGKGNQLHHGSGSDDIGKSGRKSGSATDDSQDAPLVSRPIKVHAHKKATKEFSDLHLRQEIPAHQGAIWTMKFSVDGSHLASAGQDRVVRVWEVSLHNGRSMASPNSSGELSPGSEELIVDTLLQTHSDGKKSGKDTSGRKLTASHPPKLFMLSEKAKCAFKGHTEDVLDLSWSSSESLLSSSMDKTVRLWSISKKVCLKIFAHNDYVTCIQFHPLDDGHFISGSLDGKVRIWSIQEPQVVDWVDLQEMVTAACYTPNGQGAAVGSYKGTCRFYKTSGNKLQLDTTFEVQSNKAKRSQGKKVTGFQFVPGDKEKILITSNDSRIRVYNGMEICSKFKGFRNTKSHISASFTSNGKYIICASEDSRVCIWNYSDPRYEYPGQQKSLAGAYEDFSAKHVLVAIPWPGMQLVHSGEQKGGQKGVGMPSDGGYSLRSLSSNPSEAECGLSNGSLSREESLSHRRSGSDDAALTTAMDNTLKSVVKDRQDTEFSCCTQGVSGITQSAFRDSYVDTCCGSSILSTCVSATTGNTGFFADSKGSATWPEEKLPSLERNGMQNEYQSSPPKSMTSKGAASPLVGGPNVHGQRDAAALASSSPAWGLVIVTAGLGGEIRVFQNYGLPVRL